MPFDPMNPYAQIMGNTMDPLQVQPPAQPLQAPAQPQQPSFLDKVGGFLSHPAVQGLLGAYFGAVSTPRHAGFGAAIGRGGLGGLAGMDEAMALRQQQQMLQQRAAQQGQLMNLRGREVAAKEGEAQTQQQLAKANIAAKQPIGLPKATSIVAGQPALQKAGLTPELMSGWTEEMVRKELDSLRTTGQHDPLIASEIARNEAEAARARRDPADATPKAKLAEIYGPGGATREESVGAGYTPPPGWSLKAPGKPTAPPKPVDPALRENRITAVNDHWNKNAPWFAGTNHPEYQEAHYQALVSAGATPEEASQLMHGYTSTTPAGMPSTSVQPAGGPGTAAAAETPPSRPAHAPPNYVHGRHANGTPGWAAPGTPDFTPDGA